MNMTLQIEAAWVKDRLLHQQLLYPLDRAQNDSLDHRQTRRGKLIKNIQLNRYLIAKFCVSVIILEKAVEDVTKITCFR